MFEAFIKAVTSIIPLALSNSSNAVFAAFIKARLEHHPSLAMFAAVPSNPSSAFIKAMFEQHPARLE